MSNMNNTTSSNTLNTVATNDTSRDVLCRFPTTREREEFPDWLFKAEAFFGAKAMLDVVFKPVSGIPQLRSENGAAAIINTAAADVNTSSASSQSTGGSSSSSQSATIVTGSSTSNSIIKSDILLSQKAYNYIIQSLHKKQLELVRGIYPGNAFMVMSALKKTYGIIKSTTTIMSLFNKLNNNKKLSHESMTDYISRIEHMIYDLQLLDSSITVSQKKYFILTGLQDDNEWKSIITALSQSDADNKWSFDQLQTYLLDQEDRKTAMKIRTAVNHHDNNDTNNNTAYHVNYRFNHRGRGHKSFRSRGRGRYATYTYHNSDNNNNINNNNQNDKSRYVNNNNHHAARGRFRSSTFKQKYRGGFNNYNNNNHNNNNNNSIRCWNCNQQGHVSTSCPSKKRNFNNNNHNNNTQYATLSSSDVHVSSDSSPPSSSSTSSSINESNKRVKYSRTYIVISQVSSSPSSSVSTSMSATSLALRSSSSHHSEWILDGGATDHYVCDKKLLINVRMLPIARSIITANGSSTCTISGTAMMYTNDNQQVSLNNVLYVSDFNVNLISVYRIVETGANVTYSSDKAIITRDEIIELEIPRINNLYVLSTSTPKAYTSSSSSSSTTTLVNTTPSPSPSPSTTTSSLTSVPSTSNNNMNNNNNDKVINELKMLHLKYGHVNYQRLYTMIKNSSVINNNNILLMKKYNMNEIMNTLKRDPCVGCLKGKMNRLPMTGVLDRHVKGKMDMWVCDLLSFSVPTINNNKYLVLPVDVYSSMTFGTLLATKDLSSQVLQETIDREQVQTGLVLKRFHSDNGSEFINNDFKNYLKKNGTIQTTSTTYTPQHNGMVERKNRSVLEMVRSMMHHAEAYIGLYGEAVMTTLYIINRTSVHNNQTGEFTGLTPYELYTGIKPTIKHFHVWGCDTYYYHHQEKRENKLDVTSLPGIFVGYDKSNETYYRIYNVDKNIIVISRDVKFYDDKFNEMRRLCAHMNEKKKKYKNNNKNNNKKNNNDNEHDHIVKDINDYLPDSLFDNNNDMILDMFGVDGDVGKRDNNDNNNNNNNNDNIDNDINDINDNSNMVNNINNNNDDNMDEESTTINNTINNNDNNDNSINNNNENNNNNNNNSSVNNVTLRRSSRVTGKPFIYDPNAYATLVLDEPITYTQALSCSDHEQWIKAINDELHAHHINHTWSSVIRNNGMNIIGCKWVFKKKRDSNGNVIKYKARLVAKGFNQQYGIDYKDTFAPVLKYKSLRIILALSISNNTILEQLDVKTAFLNAKVSEDIYMEVPEGLTINNNQVLKLNKALYGIKQAPREWYSEISSYLISIGYIPCKKDSCLYVKLTKNNNNIILGLFVDDMMVSYHVSDEKEWFSDKQKLKQKYDLTELGEVKQILGMRITKINNNIINNNNNNNNTNNYSILLNQSVYVNDKLQLFGFDKSRYVSTPEVLMKTMIGNKSISHDVSNDVSVMSMNNNNNNNNNTSALRQRYVSADMNERVSNNNYNNNNINNEDKYEYDYSFNDVSDKNIKSDMSDNDINTYRTMVGSLIYASISTRPDITHAVNIVSRYMTNPTKVNMVMVKRVLRYLAGTSQYGLLYDNNNNTGVYGEVNLTGYCDADWGGDLIDRKSTTGYCTFINGNMISWCTKKQRTVALSSTEAEYMAINEIAKEIMWLRIILKELSITVKTPTIIYVDNQSAIRISENDTEHDRTKHIDIRHYYIRELIVKGDIKLKWLPTSEQLADIFTKPLGGTIFTNLRDKLMKKYNNNNNNDNNNKQ